jgi:hypothetical protein
VIFGLLYPIFDKGSTDAGDFVTHSAVIGRQRRSGFCHPALYQGVSPASSPS